MHLTLLVPELIWPEPGDAPTLGDLPASHFAWLDGHARLRRSTPVAYEKALLDCFALAADGPAVFRRLGEADAPAPDDGAWLCADPVHLRFHHERIVLADSGAFDLDEGEAQALVAALNTEFADVGVFHMATARRWYLRLHVAVDHVAEPLSAVAGRRMDSELQDKTSPLHRWLNEVQMFLHLHPVNAARAAAGKPAINSLWLWGGGKTGKTGDRPRFSGENRGLSPVLPDAIFADDPLAIGLGRAAGSAVHGRPATPEGVLASGAQRPLVVLDLLLPTVLYEDPAGWRRAFADLDAGWFAPLRGQLGKKLKTLDLIAPTIYGRLQWTVDAGARWKFWKKGRTPAALARTLADTPPEGGAS